MHVAVFAPVAVRILRWLREPERVPERWLGKHCVLVAWFGLLIAAVSPPHGSGISLCWFLGATELPCPGCGLTRSLSCGLRGMFSESLQYHPMGLLILGLFVFTAGQKLCPAAFRDRLARFMQSRATVVNTFYLVFVVAFVGFGLVRALYHGAVMWVNTSL